MYDNFFLYKAAAILSPISAFICGSIAAFELRYFEERL
jgi:hypothetical protein